MPGLWLDRQFKLRERESGDNAGGDDRNTAMAHCLGKAHLDRHVLARVNTAIMLGLVGSGLAACALGAFVYDVGRLFSVW